MELEGHLNYLKTIVDNLNDIIWVINLGDNECYEIAYVNPIGLAAVGRESDVIGKRINEITSNENYEKLVPVYRRVKQERQIIEEEIKLTAPVGEKHYAIKFVPVLNAVGDCVQIITISRDLTE